MAIKTDMSKAFDRVEWNFLEELMRKMGFDERWISWIMAFIRTVTYTVLINRRPHSFIKPERGIRQGDPLSPFIFILCAEALVHSLNESESLRKLNGISLAPQGPAVHHLLFPDDSFLLCKASCETVWRLIVASKSIVKCLAK
ncbi:putative mitochondrial protein [Cardamine amara subsp. amara]|uniref:Mitochondrial protein n=1 Tax=Cardamine amara subsp. amara TaxID=228776 RepID=A0ABD1BTN1_CARAN